MKAVDLAERGWLPDVLVRRGIRTLLRRRLRGESVGDPEMQAMRYHNLIRELSEPGIAMEPGAASRQHSEVPDWFFRTVLGHNLKYSSGLWVCGVETLADAELAMLKLTARRAELDNGQDILELGCGWGALTLWMAAQFPESSITAVSDSSSQREYIMATAAERGLKNVEVIARDINTLEVNSKFDRVVSVEMFEHVRNYRQLLGRINGWLKSGGRLFIHIFCHRWLMYPFVSEDEDDWMARHFFAGGLMPASDTLLFFQEQLVCEQRWLINGRHYGRTARAWLQNLDAARRRVRVGFGAVYGDDAGLWVQRWRMFFMACEELFNTNRGNEWMVAHYRFRKR